MPYLTAASAVERKKVENLMTKSFGNRLRIIKIEKIRSNYGEKMFYERRERIKAENNGDANEKWLFHGTVNYEGIIKEGFRLKYARAGSYGKGLYFSPNSSLSNGFSRPAGTCNCTFEQNCQSCVKIMLECKVLLGKTCTTIGGNSALTEPPVGYHSVTGGDIVVIYNSFRVLPAFKITYKS